MTRRGDSAANRGVCPRCGRADLVSVDFFSSHPEACKDCLRKANNAHAVRAYHGDLEQSRARSLQKQKKFMAKNRDRVNADRKQLRRKDPRIELRFNAMKRAKERSLPFALKPEDIVVPSSCPILGIPLMVGDGKVCQNSPSLDRIIPELGYVPGNVRVISFRANSLRQDATIEELRLVLKDLENLATRKVIQ